MLTEQESSRKQYQQEMAEELSRMRQNIKEVWSNIGMYKSLNQIPISNSCCNLLLDESTSKLLQLVNQLNTQYHEMQSGLDAINNTIAQVLVLLDSTNEAVNIQLGWLLERLGGAQDGLYLLTSVATHGVFLLANCLVLLFLKAPWFSRLMLLVITVLNLIIDINTSNGLSLAQLAVLMGIVFIGQSSNLISIITIVFIIVYQQVILSFLVNIINIACRSLHLPHPFLPRPPLNPVPLTAVGTQLIYQTMKLMIC